MDIKRNDVIALHLAGKSNAIIVRELQHQNVNRKFVCRTINRYRDTGSIAKRNNGGPTRTATSSDMIQKVKDHIEQDPKKSARQIAKELHVSDTSVRRILSKELQLKSYKAQEVQVLGVQQKAERPERINPSQGNDSNAEEDLD